MMLWLEMSKRFERMQCNKCKQEFPIDEIKIFEEGLHSDTLSPQIY